MAIQRHWVLGLILGSTFQEVMDFVISGAMLTTFIITLP
jgi:hypothetical protein